MPTFGHFTLKGDGVKIKKTLKNSVPFLRQRLNCNIQPNEVYTTNPEK